MGVVSNKNLFNHEGVVKKVFQVISDLISFCDCLCVEKCIGDYDLDYVLGILDWIIGCSCFFLAVHFFFILAFRDFFLYQHICQSQRLYPFTSY